MSKNTTKYEDVLKCETNNQNTIKLSLSEKRRSMEWNYINQTKVNSQTMQSNYLKKRREKYDDIMNYEHK